MAGTRDFFSAVEIQRLERAVREAEQGSSGEIRVRIAAEGGPDPVAAAAAAFEALGMTNTKNRNGVMFFLGTRDHALVVLGDEGIVARVTDDFWDVVRDVVLRRFQAGEFVEGLEDGIRFAGDQLAAWFPRKAEDVNELPDAVSFADEGGGNA
jgi:uncharacterized membrane protein